MGGGGKEEERNKGRCNNDNNDNDNTAVAIAFAVAVAVGAIQDYGLPCANNCLPKTSAAIDNGTLPHAKNG